MSNTQTRNTATNEHRDIDIASAIIAFFLSPVVMMVALALALLAQGKHTADVFTYYSHDNTPWWLSYAFAAGVEVAVFLFVLHGHKGKSYTFAFAAFATNVVYYAIGGAALLTAELVPVLLLSALLPGVIVGYSHTIAEKPMQAATQPQRSNTRPWWKRLAGWRNSPEYSPAVPSEGTTAPRKKNNPNGSAVSTAVAPLSAAETPSEGVSASARPLERTGEKSAAGEGSATPLAPTPALRKISNVTVNATDTELAAQLGVTRQAVAGMRRRGTLAARVARDLPDLAPVHVNGNGYHA